MIKFHSIRWRNFLSTGNEFTEIILDSHRTTLISGTNGAGKSTLLDALSYGLYKKAFRDINIPTLINSVNQRECLVEVEFSIGSRTYVVRRGMKPSVFEVYVNGEIIPQSANVFDYQENLEKNILRMNYKTFTQIVVLGSAGYVPFMLLPAQNRREIIENLLDIDVFSRMNTVLKAMQKATETKINDYQTKMKIVKSKIDLMERHIKELETNNDSKIEEITANLDKLDSIRLGFETALDQANEDYRQAADAVPDLLSLGGKLAKAKEAKRQIDAKEKKLLEAVEAAAHLESCPTCNRVVDLPTRMRLRDSKAEVHHKAKKMSETLAGKIQALELEWQEAQNLSTKANEKQARIREFESQIRVKEAESKSLRTQLKSLQKSREEIDTTELDRHVLAYRMLTDKRNELLEQNDLQSTAATLLKDGGIKTMIIRKYIPLMNKLINKYLEQMDLFILFEIDETFKETMKAMYKDEMVYSSLSQGERMRVDIALLFTWREIARMRNAALTNILVLDEIMDSSLDGPGTEEFLKIIQNISQSSNILIISHKSDQIVDKFDRMIQFEKKNNFSEMVPE